MGRKPRRWLRIGLAVGSWACAVGLVQVVVGVEISGGSQQIEDGIELRLKERGTSVPVPRQPARTHEERIEPWELIGV
jgi:hypothetical protein